MRLGTVLIVFLICLCLSMLWLLHHVDSDLVSLGLAVGITVVTVLAAVGVWVFGIIRARRAAAGLDSMLKDQAKQQASLTRPDLQLELDHMQQEFDRAISTLKGGGRGGRNALYRLPWYAIIGPPGAGKSTALRNSGLTFPYLGDRGGAIKGVGGTRNCDWWLANEGIVLDTAGRWATEDEDREEWLGFLGMLKKYRARKPLNGLLAAVSVGEIAQARDDELDQLARKMRARVDEVVVELGVTLPIYVLFTKCDLVDGFVQMFGDLRRFERNQVWGFTVPLSEDTGEPGAFAEARLAEQSHVLRTRALGRMCDERASAVRRAVYSFPQQFDLMRRNLVRFISLLFEHNAYQETPILRGVYFTSGTQEGRPFNLLIERLAGELGDDQRGSAHSAVVDQKSYFLHDVFMNVIFQDRDIASASQSEYRRMRSRRAVLAGALGAGAVCFSVAPGVASYRQSSRLDDTKKVVSDAMATYRVRAADWDQPRPEFATTMDVLKRLEREEADYADGMQTSLWNLGIYRGAALQGPLLELHAAMLGRQVLEPLMAKVAYDMESALARRDPAESELLYDRLRLHLLLTYGSQHDRAAPRIQQQSELADWTRKQLKTIARDVPALRSAKRAEVSALIEQAVGLMGATEADTGLSAEQVRDYLMAARDQALVDRTRRQLTEEQDWAAQAVWRLVARVKGRDVELKDLVGANDRLFSNANKKVLGAFTRDGWVRYVRPVLTGDRVEEFVGESWVLGLEAGEREAADRQRYALSSAYFQQYIEAWLAFLQDLRVVTPEARGEKSAQARTDRSIKLLSALTAGAQPPVAALLRRVHREVNLPLVVDQDLEKDEESKQRWLDWVFVLARDAYHRFAEAGDVRHEKALLEGGDYVQVSEVADRFALLTGFAVPPEPKEGQEPLPVDFDSYHASLVELRKLLVGGDQAGAQRQAAIVMDDVEALALKQPRVFREVLRELLRPPLAYIGNQLRGGELSDLGEQWCNEVFRPFSEQLADRFPFAQTAEGVSLSAFTQHFHPEKGAFEVFVQGALASEVTRSGNRYKRRGSATDIRDDFLLYLGRAREVGLAFFPGGAEEARIDMEIRIQAVPGIDSTTVSIGGQEISHGTEREVWQRISWPGPDPDAGTAWTVRGMSVKSDTHHQGGVWGFFRLIQRAEVRKVSQAEFEVRWPFVDDRNQHQHWRMGVRLRGAVRPSPFFGPNDHETTLLGWLSRKPQQMPAQIASAAVRCR